MAVKKEDVVGLPTGASTIQVERGPVTKFAESLQNDDPVYKNLEAAKAAGFDHIPAAPTFTFASQHWGIFEGEQPEDPTGGKGSPMRSIMGNLMANGGNDPARRTEVHLPQAGHRRPNPSPRRQGGRFLQQRG